MEWTLYPESIPPENCPLWCTFQDTSVSFVGEAQFSRAAGFFDDFGPCECPVLAFIVLPEPL